MNTKPLSLIYIALLLTILSLGVTIYELKKPDFTIEHAGIIVLREQTGQGCLILFHDGYVMLLSAAMDVCVPYWESQGGYATLIQGRDNFIYYEYIGYGSQMGDYVTDYSDDYRDYNITDVTPLFVP